MPTPSRLRRWLLGRLPGASAVNVVPRDENYKRCPAYAADQFEITAFSTSFNTATAEALQGQLGAVPGVFATALFGVGSNDPSWPIAYRDAADFRPLVKALYREPAAAGNAS